MTTKSELYVTRISPATPTAVEDFTQFRKEIEMFGSGVWDKDKQNRMVLGDYWAVIVGEKKSEVVEIYRISADLKDIERPVHWRSSRNYNTDNGVHGVAHRHVIRLVKVIPFQIPWVIFKSMAKWSPTCNTWMPRGTTRCIKGKDIIQFINNPNAYIAHDGRVEEV